MREHHSGLKFTPGSADAFDLEHLRNRKAHLTNGVPAGNVVLKFYFDGTTPRDSLNVPAGMPPGLRIGR